MSIRSSSSTSSSYCSSSGGAGPPTPPPMIKNRKVVMFGFSAVGKSSLASQFIDSKMDTVYNPTIQQAWNKTFYVGNELFELDVYDTAGSDEYTMIPIIYFYGVHGYIIVYSVTCARSFQIAKTMRTTISDHNGRVPVPIVLVANKTDLPKQTRQVTTQEGRELAESWGAAFMEVTATDTEMSKSVFVKMIEEIDRMDRPSPSPTEKRCILM